MGDEREGGGERFCFLGRPLAHHLGDSGGHNFYHLAIFMNTELYCLRYTVSSLFSERSDRGERQHQKSSTNTAA